MTPDPVTVPPGMARPVVFVTANTFEFDSRTRRAAATLAGAGHEVTVVAIAANGLPADAIVDGTVRVRRPPLDRRILAGLRPLPGPVRGWLGARLAIGPEDERLTDAGRGRRGSLRRLLRRAVEILAWRRRLGPWTDAVAAAAAPGAIVVTKSLVALPVAVAAATRVGGLAAYDVADLHVESGRLAGMPAPLRRWIGAREARLIDQVAIITAVSDPMADEIARRYHVSRPVVIRNTRPRWRAAEPEPREPDLRRAATVAGIPNDHALLLYQGAFRPGQGIETLVRALEDDRLREAPVSAVFLGFGPLERQLAAEAARRPDRVAVLPPVASESLLAWTSGADVAFVGAPPETRNQELTIPNKLFESLMAGVPVIVAGGTAMASIVAADRLGRVVTPWTATALAATIAELSSRPDAERAAERRRIRALALERYAWEVESAALVAAFAIPRAATAADPRPEAMR